MNEQIKNWLKTNWFKAGLLIILIICIGGAFYWYEWRPNQIRKECADVLLQWIQKNPDVAPSKVSEFLNLCLMKHGLEQ